MHKSSRFYSGNRSQRRATTHPVDGTSHRRLRFFERWLEELHPRMKERRRLNDGRTSRDTYCIKSSSVPYPEVWKVQLQTGNKCFICLFWSLCLWYRGHFPSHLAPFHPSTGWTCNLEHRYRCSGVCLYYDWTDCFGPGSLCCYISSPVGAPDSWGWVEMSLRGCSVFLTSVHCWGSAGRHLPLLQSSHPHPKVPWSPAGGSQGCRHSCSGSSGVSWWIGG